MLKIKTSSNRSSVKSKQVHTRYTGHRINYKPLKPHINLKKTKTRSFSTIPPSESSMSRENPIYAEAAETDPSTGTTTHPDYPDVLINPQYILTDKQTHYNKAREWFKSIGSPKTVSAPMVNQSELPFRLLVRQYGCDVAYTPMLNSNLSITERRMTNSYETDPKDTPLFVQICGPNVDCLIDLALEMQGRGATAIDLNLGCPQHIARRGRYGSYLLEETLHVQRIIHELYKVLTIPITVKMRILLDDNKEYTRTAAYAKALQDTGASLITLHGRTRVNKKDLVGQVDFSAIAKVRQSITIPFYANGGIGNYLDVYRALELTKADGIMTSEALLEFPSLFKYPIRRSQLLHYTERAKYEEGCYYGIDTIENKDNRIHYSYTEFDPEHIKTVPLQYFTDKQRATPQLHSLSSIHDLMHINETCGPTQIMLASQLCQLVFTHPTWLGTLRPHLFKILFRELALFTDVRFALSSISPLKAVEIQLLQLLNCKQIDAWNTFKQYSINILHTSLLSSTLLSQNSKDILLQYDISTTPATTTTTKPIVSATDINYLTTLYNIMVNDGILSSESSSSESLQQLNRLRKEAMQAFPFQQYADDADILAQISAMNPVVYESKTAQPQPQNPSIEECNTCDPTPLPLVPQTPVEVPPPTGGVYDVMKHDNMARCQRPGWNFVQYTRRTSGKCIPVIDFTRESWFKLYGAYCIDAGYISEIDGEDYSAIRTTITTDDLSTTTSTHEDPTIRKTKKQKREEYISNVTATVHSISSPRYTINTHNTAPYIQLDNLWSKIMGLRQPYDDNSTQTNTPTTLLVQSTQPSTSVSSSPLVLDTVQLHEYFCPLPLESTWFLERLYSTRPHWYYRYPHIKEILRFDSTETKREMTSQFTEIQSEFNRRMQKSQHRDSTILKQQQQIKTKKQQERRDSTTTTAAAADAAASNKNNNKEIVSSSIEIVASSEQSSTATTPALDMVDTTIMDSTNDNTIDLSESGAGIKRQRPESPSTTPTQ